MPPPATHPVYSTYRNYECYLYTIQSLVKRKLGEGDMPSLQVSLPLVKLTPLARRHWLLWTECVIRQDGHTRLTVGTRLTV